MSFKSFAVASAVFAVVAAGCGLQFVPAAHAQGCDATDRIDNSTADSAKNKIERAGFKEIRGLKKSCDNFWHGKAVRDGVAVHVVLSPQGEAMTEGE